MVGQVWEWRKLSFDAGHNNAVTQSASSGGQFIVVGEQSLQAEFVHRCQVETIQRPAVESRVRKVLLYCPAEYASRQVTKLEWGHISKRR
jgi:hypothetical protein